VTEKAHTVTVHILDKEYKVACPVEQTDELRASARMLDRQMRDIRDGGKVLGADRMAVMAALNLAHELLQIRQAHDATQTQVDQRVGHLNARLDQVLAEQKQMSL
jgi:cell division protein ZapA